MPYHRNHKTYAKYTSRADWLCQNEDRLRELWNAMRNFLEHTNSNLLNFCTYEALCQFAADHSYHFDDRD